MSRYFGEGSGLGGGGGGANGAESALKCNDCGVGLIAGFDAMGNPDGLGVLCKGCWADMWIPHPHGNVAGLAGNTCTMGIRWTKEEWQAIQGITNATIMELGKHLGRMPGANDYPTLKLALDPQLGKFQRSMKCNSCKTDVVFKPSADDVPMAGINTPAQG